MTNLPEVTTPQQLESKAVELSARSFEAFGEDIACMFGVEISGKDLGSKVVTLVELKKQYRKLVSLCSVNSAGGLIGTFHLILDQEAFFTLAGVLVVQPEKSIIQNRKHGTGEAAQELSDAIGEVANLMVGSFERIFRQEMPGHFVLAKTFIGSPWAKPADVGLLDTSEYVVSSYETTIDKFAPFTCSVLYAKDIFIPKPAPEQADQNVLSVATAEPVVQSTTDTIPPASPQPEGNASFMPIPAQPSIATDVPQPAGPVSESIRKMTASSAVLPGEPLRDSVALAEAMRNNVVSQIMRTDIAWLGPDDTVEIALAESRRLATEYILIGKDNHVEGILSNSDLRGAASPYLQPLFAHWRRPLDLATLNIRLKWVMTKPVQTIGPNASVADAAAVMYAGKIGALPVVDQASSILGIITTHELLRFVSTLS